MLKHFAHQAPYEDEREARAQRLLEGAANLTPVNNGKPHPGGFTELLSPYGHKLRFAPRTTGTQIETSLGLVAIVSRENAVALYKEALAGSFIRVNT